jgi:hypothetical protein
MRDRQYQEGSHRASSRIQGPGGLEECGAGGANVVYQAGDGRRRPPAHPAEGPGNIGLPLAPRQPDLRSGRPNSAESVLDRQLQSFPQAPRQSLGLVEAALTGPLRMQWDEGQGYKWEAGFLDSTGEVACQTIPEVRARTVLKSVDRPLEGTFQAPR